MTPILTLQASEARREGPETAGQREAVCQRGPTWPLHSRGYAPRPVHKRQPGDVVQTQGGGKGALATEVFKVVKAQELPYIGYKKASSVDDE